METTLNYYILYTICLQQQTLSMENVSSIYRHLRYIFRKMMIRICLKKAKHIIALYENVRILIVR